MKHFPRIPREKDCQPVSDVILFIICMVLVLMAFGLAGTEDYKTRLVMDEAAVKENIIRNQQKQLDADSRAALHFYTERSKP